MKRRGEGGYCQISGEEEEVVRRRKGNIILS
jgi:hypothetical protein